MTVAKQDSRGSARSDATSVGGNVEAPEALHSEPEREPTHMSERVDDLEKALGIALGDYRRAAELALTKHLEGLERMESAQQLAMANLRAENGMLREKLGLQSQTEPPLWQSVALVENKVEEKGKGTTGRSGEKGNRGMTKSTTRGFAAMMNGGDDKDEERLLNHRKGQSVEKTPKPGGTWQQFVAWVPNGAALKAPEPWRPLQPQVPPGAPAILGANSQQSPVNTHNSQSSLANFNTVVPGSVANDDQDADSNSTGSSQAKQEDFEVLDCWRASKHALDKLRKHRENGDSQSAYTQDKSLGGSTDDGEENVFEDEAPHVCIVHPHSNKRIVWDLSSLIMVVYDMVMIPMGVFDLQEEFFIQFMEWTTRIFWTVDMGWSMSTGVVLPDGKVEFTFRVILKRYLKTWFGLDVFIVGSDWGMVALSTSNSVGFTRLARSLRIVRVVRLLRLVRMQEIIASITERIQSDKLSYFLSIVKLLVIVLGISHVLGCIWWGIGCRSSTEATWVGQTTYGSADVPTQYLVSLHWGLSQLTGGMEEVTPASTIERLYAVFVWVFAFMIASIIVSTLTSNLTQLHIIGGSQSRQLATLRKYLNQNHVSSNLALRVIRCAQHAVSGDLTQDSVDMLQVVSEPLKVEMHFSMYGSVLRCHPFFCDYLAEGPQVMRRVCHYAMSTMLLAAGDVIFSRGEVLPEPKMYIVWRGSLEYVCGYGLGTPVAEKHWVAEMNLWTKWKHRGTLTATGDAKLALLDAKRFQEIARRYKDSNAFDPKLYAADFVNTMNTADDLDDLTSICSR